MLRRASLALLCLLVLAVFSLLTWPEADYVRWQPDADYLAEVATYDIPDFPDGWQTPLFTASDGTRLRWGETGNRDTAKATVVIVPGYTATLDMYGEHVGMLQARGYHVMALDLRGQGMSERARPDKPEKLFVEDFGVYADDLAAFLAENAPADTAVIPLAMSFGGHVALRTAMDRPGTVDGLFLLAPAVQPNPGDADPKMIYRAAAIADALGRGKRYLPGQRDWRPQTRDFSAIPPDRCATEPKRAWLKDAIYTRQPQQRVGGVTAGWLKALVDSSDRMLAASTVPEVPTVMVRAEHETYVENDAIAGVCGRMRNCELLDLPGTGHCLMQESDAVLTAMFDRLDAMVEANGLARAR